MKIRLSILMLLLVCSTAVAAPVSYDIDPDHTHPSFETDHFGGLSVWRGFFTKSHGSIVLDKTAGSGTVDVTADAASIDLGQDQVNKVVVGPDNFDAAKYPTLHYQGTLGGFVDGAPTTVTGKLTMHGVTKPLVLKILSFKCMPHPLFKREVCGADAYGTLDRDDFGMDSGKTYGFKMQVILRIQVEAIARKD
ncbi:MAG: YceI family protein [Gammaproteobacteria bacterium]